MYSVSNAFLAQMLSPVIESKIAGTVNGIAFTEANILSGSLKICAMNASQDAIEIGTAASKELSITFMHDLGLVRNTLYQKEIVIEYKLKLPGNSYESLPLGTYIITEANWTLRGIECTAYDYISKFDTPIDDASENYPASGFAWDYLDFVCTQCGVTNGMTQADVEALPNGQITMQYAEGGAATHREFLGYLAAAVGCYAIVDRNNNLLLKRYDKNGAYDTYNNTQRLTNASFSDFITKYNAFTIADLETNSTQIYQNDGYTGLTMDLGRNIFLNSPAKSFLRANVLASLESIAFAPFSASFNFPPIYDLGDNIKLTGGIGDSNLHCINYFSWAYNRSLTLEGYGANPALAAATSATDRKISGLATMQELNTTGIITAQNRQDIGASSVRKTIVSMSAQPSKTATGVFTAMVPIEVTTAGEFTFYHEQAYNVLRSETVYLDVGKHIVTLHDFITLPPGIATNFRILVNTDGTADGTIYAYATRASLLAPSAIGGVFDGNLFVEDTVALWTDINGTFKTDLENVLVAVQTPLAADGNDIATKWTISEPTVSGATESISFIMIATSGARVLEEDEADVRTLENGTDYRLTEEEQS